MPILRDSANFRRAEFRHPELVDDEAFAFLEEVRQLYQRPIKLTSDARTPAENTAAGGTAMSWHVRGRAFDFAWPKSDEDAWLLVEAIVQIANAWRYRPERKYATIELELVYSEVDKHVHVAVKNNGKPSRLIVAAD